MDKKNDEFIDLNVNNCVVDFREQYREEYEIIEECIYIFRLFEEKIEKIGPTRKNAYILAALMQVNKLYQSSILLLERGLKESANIINRTILETIFKMVAVIRNENFIDFLNISQDIENQSILQYLKSKELFDMVPQYKLEKQIEKIDKDIKADNCKKTKISNIARDNNMEREYALYKMLCDYTHQSNFVIGSTIIIEENRCIVNGNFQIDDFKESVAFLISIAIIIFPFLFDEYIKDIELKDKYEEFTKKFESIFKNILE